MRLVQSCCLLLAVAASPAYSQIFSIGVKAGVPLTSAFTAGQNGFAVATEYDRRFIIGPTAEVHLPLHFSLEVDALYRRNGFTLTATDLTGAVSTTHTAVNDWQIPILGKYEIVSGPLRPFLDAGVVYRHVPTSVSGLAPNNANSAGIAVGGGITLKALLLRLSPEIRYTHWPSPPYNNSGLIVQSTANQVDLLVGFTF